MTCKNCNGKGHNMMFNPDLNNRILETCSVCGGSGIESNNSFMNKPKKKNVLFYGIIIILTILTFITTYFIIF